MVSQLIFTSICIIYFINVIVFLKSEYVTIPKLISATNHYGSKFHGIRKFTNNNIPTLVL